MSYSLLDKSDPRNMIKKCPFCELIWIKVSGCDGETFCGNVPTGEKEFLKGNFLRFVFNFVKGKLYYKKNVEL